MCIRICSIIYIYIYSPEKSTGLSRDEYAAAMQMAHDKPVNSNKDLDDDIICIDEDSDRYLASYISLI